MAVNAQLASLECVFLKGREFKYVIENTVGKNMLRKLVLREVARDIRRDGWEAFKKGNIYFKYVDGDPERLKVLMEAVADCRDGDPRESDKERCELWHVHKTIPKCT